MAGIRGSPDRTEAGNSGGPKRLTLGRIRTRGPSGAQRLCGDTRPHPASGLPCMAADSHTLQCVCVWGGGHDPRTSHPPPPVQDNKGPRVSLVLRSVLHGPRAGLNPHSLQWPPTHPNAPRLPASTPQPSPFCFLGPPPR